jgi:transposase
MAQDWLRKKLPRHIRGLLKSEWPALSPDLNLIERLWAILQNRVIELEPSTKEELIVCVKKTWWEIDQEVIRHLYNGMPNRISKCLAKEGGRFLR